jgi:hypothetical protein
MNDQENFLARWSRRKLETGGEKAPADKPVPEDVGTPAAEDGESGRAIAARAADAKAAPAPEFDVNSLPSLDSIGASSDMSLFMQAGVPSQLRNAALRRAWAADPAIRDFVGLAENAWDFTDPNAMEGFGALDPNIDLKKLVDDIFRDSKIESAQADSPAEREAAAQTAHAERLEGGVDGDSSTPESGSDPETPERLAALPNSAAMLQREENIATHPENFAGEDPAVKVGRGPDDSEPK